MSNKTKHQDGGPAFPVLSYEYKAHPGMTLRDWFAGMALQGMLGGSAPDIDWPDPEVAAEKCFAYADAMLAERDNNT